MEIARSALPWLENHKLSTLAKYFELDLNHHDARSDSEVCAAITLRMVAGFESGRVSIREINRRADFAAPVSKSPFSGNPFRPSGISESLLDVSKLATSDRLAGTLFVITGEFEKLTREDAISAIETLGGSVAKASVTKKTTHLIVGNDVLNDENKTGKYKKAVEYNEKGQNITFWTEDEFLKFLGFEE